MLRQPLSPVLEHKNSNSRFEDVPPPLENGIDRIASFDRPPPLELIFDEKKSIEEKKDHPNPGEGRCYSLAMTGLSAHGALAIGIGGFTALTTLMEYISEKSQTGEKPEPWGFQFILTMGIAIIGGLILSIATYRGRSTNRQEREEKLNHLICNAEKISEEAHQLAKQTISRRKKVKNMLKMTYAGQKSLYDFFKISQEFKTPREVPYLTHKKKEGKQNNSFHCSFRKTGNVFLHFLAGSVNLITHLLAIQSLINFLNQHDRLHIPLSDSEIWLICGGLILVFDGYGIFNIYKSVNRSEELYTILTEKEGTYHQAAANFSEIKNIINIHSDQLFEELSNEAKRFNQLLSRVSNKFVPHTDLSDLMGHDWLSSTYCLTKGKAKAQLKHVWIRVFQTLNALTAAGSVAAAHLGLYYFIKSCSSDYIEEALMIGVSVNGILASLQALYYGWHGVETGLYRFKLHQSPQRILENAIDHIENDTNRSLKKQKKMVHDIYIMQSIFRDPHILKEGKDVPAQLPPPLEPIEEILQPHEQFDKATCTQRLFSPVNKNEEGARSQVQLGIMPEVL